MGSEGKGAVNPGAAARKVLVIKLSALGDFVMALGAMEAIRRFHPAGRITLLTTPPYKAFAEKCPFIDVVETDGRPPKMSDARALVNRIRAEKYDIVYDLHCSGRTANYFRAAALPGRKPPLWSGHAKGCAFAHDRPDRKTLHPIDRHAEQLEIAGLGPFGRQPPLPDLSWVAPALRHNPRLTPAYFNIAEPYALIIPGASAHRGAKRWPVTHFTDITGRVADAGFMPVLIGGKAEGEINSQIARAEPRARNLTTRTDLFQLATLGAGARLAIGNDTGPMHMATLAGAPGVALFATEESSPDNAVPRGGPVIAVHAPRLEAVSPDDVWQAVRALRVLNDTVLP